MYCRTEPMHEKANSKGLYPLHRVLVENKIGRHLLPKEQVHHKDGNKQNNDITNLELLSISDHTKIHNPKLEDIEAVCKLCNETFKVKGNLFRLRLKRNKSGFIFCSRSCSSKFTNSNKNS